MTSKLEGLCNMISAQELIPHRDILLRDVLIEFDRRLGEIERPRTDPAVAEWLAKQAKVGAVVLCPCGGSGGSWPHTQDFCGGNQKPVAPAAAHAEPNGSRPELTLSDRILYSLASELATCSISLTSSDKVMRAVRGSVKVLLSEASKLTASEEDLVRRIRNAAVEGEGESGAVLTLIDRLRSEMR